MTGTFINIGTVILGSLLGMLLKNKIKSSSQLIIMQALGLFTLFLGVQMSLKTQNPLLLIFSLLIGGLLGEKFKLEYRLERIGDLLKNKLKIGDGRFTEGLVTAFMVFCIGSMTIIGSIEEGLGNPPRLLMTKSLMDGFSSMALASALGIGVLFSVIPLLLFQGGLTLLAYYAGNYMSELMINELIATGGILLIGLGISLLEIKKIKVVNLIPSLIMILILIYLKGQYLPSAFNFF